jgi:hypothetical protein
MKRLLHDKSFQIIQFYGAPDTSAYRSHLEELSATDFENIFKRVGEKNLQCAIMKYCFSENHACAIKRYVKCIILIESHLSNLTDQLMW